MGEENKNCKLTFSEENKKKLVDNDAYRGTTRGNSGLMITHGLYHLVSYFDNILLIIITKIFVLQSNSETKMFSFDMYYI